MARLKHPPISRVALYVRDMQGAANFYAQYFGFQPEIFRPRDKAVLVQPGGGLRLVLLQASKGHRRGQSGVKLIFDVEDVAVFHKSCAARGLKFGPIHRGPGYEFANARDLAGNLIQISNGYRADP